MTGEGDSGADSGGDVSESGSDAGSGAGKDSGLAPTNVQLPADAGNDNPAEVADSSSEGEGESAYSLPDEHKEKSWASKIKEEGDLYKQIDNLTELVGKKTITPIDYSSASAEDIAAHHKSIVPEDAGAYSFAEEGDADFQKALVPALQEAGIHPGQLKMLEPAINKIASEMVGAQHAKDRSEEGYFELTEKAFGEGHKDTVLQIEEAYKSHLPDDAKGFLDNASNSERIFFDQTVKSIMDAKDAEIAKIKEEYGVKETGAQVGSEAATTAVNIDDKITGARKELRELEAKPGQKDWKAIADKKSEIQKYYDTKVKQKR